MILNGFMNRVDVLTNGGQSVRGDGFCCLAVLTHCVYDENMPNVN